MHIYLAIWHLDSAAETALALALAKPLTTRTRAQASHGVGKGGAVESKRRDATKGEETRYTLSYRIHGRSKCILNATGPHTTLYVHTVTKPTRYPFNLIYLTQRAGARVGGGGGGVTCRHASPCLVLVHCPPTRYLCACFASRL